MTTQFPPDFSLFVSFYTRVTMTVRPENIPVKLSMVLMRAGTGVPFGFECLNVTIPLSKKIPTH